MFWPELVEYFYQEMEKVAEDINPICIPMFYDRMALMKGRPQRYGTQIIQNPESLFNNSVNHWKFRFGRVFPMKFDRKSSRYFNIAPVFGQIS